VGKLSEEIFGRKRIGSFRRFSFRIYISYGFLFLLPTGVIGDPGSFAE
jgi:hypothetical protein